MQGKQRLSYPAWDIPRPARSISSPADKTEVSLLNWLAFFKLYQVRP
jgi:hypothetical protein